MLITPALAQVGGGGGGSGLIEGPLPIALIFAVFYFLLIRPQQQRMKKHKSMVAALRRGDKVVTGGGVIGAVTKVVDDNEVVVEIAADVKVRLVRSTITEVLTKPAPAGEGGIQAPGPQDTSIGGTLMRFLTGRK